jgi:hypothetical protein
MTVAGFPFWALHFDADANLTGPDARALTTGAAASGITDLFVFSHGWNNDEAGAMRMYSAFFAEIAKLPVRPGTSIGVAGVMWPAILFPENGVASALETELPKVFTRAAQQPALQAVLDLVSRKPANMAALFDFRNQLASILRAEVVHTATAEGQDNLEFQTATAGEPAWQQILRAMAGTSAGVEGGAADFGDVFGTLWHGALNVLRVATFWQMKNRAGIVGRNGLGPLLGQIHEAAPSLRIHLIGHSFGARLVSYALSGLPPAASPVKSLLLLQGAFSHFAFADALPFDSSRRGDLRGMASRVDGPLVATFSRKDMAVGMAYPAAAIVARQDAADAGDLMYRWEGMGSDGAQAVYADCVPLARVGTVYPFRPGHWLNLDGNQVIKAGGPPEGAHGDIIHPETAWAALAAARIGL